MNNVQSQNENLMLQHMAGGFTLERPPSPREKEVLESAEVKKGLEFMSNVSFSEVEAISVKS